MKAFSYLSVEESVDVSFKEKLSSTSKACHSYSKVVGEFQVGVSKN